MTKILRRLRPRALTLIALAAAVPIALGVATPAFAAWSGNGTGPSAGAATTMPTGSAPNGSAAVSSVTITWTAAKLGNGSAVAGYVVHRYNAVTGAPATVGAACAGVVTATTCTESSVPAGAWAYTDTPVQLSWTGGESPDSSSITVP